MADRLLRKIDMNQLICEIETILDREKKTLEIITKAQDGLTNLNHLNTNLNYGVDLSFNLKSCDLVEKKTFEVLLLQLRNYLNDEFIFSKEAE